MASRVPMIGLSADELPWIRKLVALLRHPDPTVPELARQALLYLSHATLPPAVPKNARMVNCRGDGADPLSGSRSDLAPIR